MAALGNYLLFIYLFIYLLKLVIISRGQVMYPTYSKTIFKK